jgi:hypothetical protein
MRSGSSATVGGRATAAFHAKRQLGAVDEPLLLRATSGWRYFAFF